MKAEEWLKGKLDSQEYTYDLMDSNRKAYPLELWVRWMEEYSKAEAQDRYDEAKKYCGYNKNPSLDFILKIASGLTKTEQNGNNNFRCL